MDWLLVDRIERLLRQNFSFEEAAEEANFWFPKGVPLQLFQMCRLIRGIIILDALFLIQRCLNCNGLYLGRALANRVR